VRPWSPHHESEPHPAESDFATWLMMAKLGSFDDLPPNAQGFLTNYRGRLERMSEAESTVVAIRPARRQTASAVLAVQCNRAKMVPSPMMVHFNSRFNCWSSGVI
jgi:hypothetical protein